MTLESIEKMRELQGCIDGYYKDSEGNLRTRLMDLLDDLELELADKYMELPVDADGVPIRTGDMTNWEKLFGTPERAAVTLATFNEWQIERARACPRPSGSTDWFAQGYLLGRFFGVNLGKNPMAILEWLESDVRTRAEG